MKKAQARKRSSKVGYDPDVMNVQVRLDAMGYSPGEIDGLWGGRTGGAIAAFINDRELKLDAPTSSAAFRSTHVELSAELSKAEIEQFKRPISKERAEATSEELAEELPEIDASIKAERTGFWTAVITSASAIITGVSHGLGDAVGWIMPVQALAADVPWPVWVFAALVVSGAIYYSSLKSGEAKRAATDAYHVGDRT